MPSPLLLARPSGPYVRFLVPLDLRPLVGSRFIVRPLGVPPGDAARLVAARMAVALSRVFEALRRGQPVDLKKALEAAKADGRKDLTLERERRADGTISERWQLDTAADVALYRQAMAADPLEAIGVMPEALALRQADAEAARRRQRSPLLSKAIADHLGDLERANLKSRTVMDSSHTLRLFAGLVGDDFPAADLSQDHVRAFFEGVRWWPSNASKREPYKSLEVRAVIRLSQANGEPEIAARTMKKHRERLSVFFNSLVKARILEASPLDGVRPVATPDTEDTGSPFTDDELGAIFGPAFAPWAAKYPHRWFGSMLGLYSGARVAEVGQLRVDDIETVDGVPGFYVRITAEGQSVKNKGSRRFVPFALPVLEAGILVYWLEAREAGHERLFPNLPNSTGLGFGRQLSRQFSTHIKRQGVDEKGQGFHGFRHTIADRLDAAGASEAAIAAITGHARGSSVLQRHYIDRRTLPDRVRTLALFVPPVSLPAYTPGQFDDALKAAPKVLPAPKRKK